MVWKHGEVENIPLAPFKSTTALVNSDSIQHALTLAPALVCLPPTGITTDLFSWLCWNLWTARNRLIFENRVTSHAAVVTNALVNAREWNQAQKIPSPPGPTPTSAPLYHAPLPPDTSLCNSDASWSQQSLQAGLGWILVNETLPQALFGSSCCNYVTSPFLAEALAIRECLRAARTAQVTKVWMRSDSQSLIRAINSKTYPMELFGVLMDIELLSSTFGFILFTFIPRAQNSGADSLAKSALCNSSSALLN